MGVSWSKEEDIQGTDNPLNKDTMVYILKHFECLDDLASVSLVNRWWSVLLASDVVYSSGCVPGLAGAEASRAGAACARMHPLPALLTTSRAAPSRPLSALVPHAVPTFAYCFARGAQLQQVRC